MKLKEMKKEGRKTREMKQKYYKNINETERE